MARVAAQPAQKYSGVYEWLREREEQRVTRWGGSDSPYPKHRIDAFRAGEPVNVPGWMLPRAVRQSADYLSRHRRLHPDGTTTWSAQTATVYPDGRIVYRPETARELLDTMGMLHDEDRHPDWREYERSLDPDD